MSLLNQVLRDLQERQVPEAPGAGTTLRDVHLPQRGKANAVPWPKLLGLGVLLLAGAATTLYVVREQPAELISAVAPASPPPVTAAAAPDTAAAPAATPSIPDVSGRVVPATTTTPSVAVDAAPIEPALAAPAHTLPKVTPTVTVPVQPTAAVAADTPSLAEPMASQAVVTAPVVTVPAAVAPRIEPVSRPAPIPRASSVAKTARPLSPDQLADLAYQDAVRLLRSGRPTAAEPRLREALDTDPEHHAARLALAGLLINAERLAEANALLGKGLSLAPQHAPFAKLYGRLRIDQGELGTARSVLERAAPAVQDDPEYHALLAALYQRLGLYELAAQSYRGALQVQTRNGVWWLGLGLALEGGGDRNSALQAYQRAQQSGTLDSEVLRYVDSKIAALR